MEDYIFEQIYSQVSIRSSNLFNRATLYENILRPGFKCLGTQIFRFF